MSALSNYYPAKRYRYASAYPVFGLDFSNRPDCFMRLGISSFIDDPSLGRNKIQILETPVGNESLLFSQNQTNNTNTNKNTNDMISIGHVEIDYPCTKLMFAPYKSDASSFSDFPRSTTDIFATSGADLLLWDVLPPDSNELSQPYINHSPHTQQYPKSAPVQMASDNMNNNRNQYTTDNNINDRKHFVRDDGTRLSQQRVRLRTKLQNSRRSGSSVGGMGDVPAPITSFDWNRVDPSTIITSSVDTTCTVWDLKQQQPKTQLIAHDKKVFDVAFRTREVNVFASVGADGSLRIFDLRDLDHSTIIYEVPFTLPSDNQSSTNMQNDVNNFNNQPQQPSRSGVRPLLRLNWNEFDSHYIATFQADSDQILILDIRVPGVTVLELNGHQPGSSVTGCVWSPKSRTCLASSATDGRALIWDVSTGNKTSGTTETPSANVEPIMEFTSDINKSHINSIAWSRARTDRLAVAFDQSLESIKV